MGNVSKMHNFMILLKCLCLQRCLAVLMANKIIQNLKIFLRILWNCQSSRAIGNIAVTLRIFGECVYTWCFAH